MPAARKIPIVSVEQRDARIFLMAVCALCLVHGHSMVLVVAISARA